MLNGKIFYIIYYEDVIYKNKTLVKCIFDDKLYEFNGDWALSLYSLWGINVLFRKPIQVHSNTVFNK